MIQRADHVYRARLFTKSHEGGFWVHHAVGIEPFAPAGVALDPVRCQACPDLHALIPRVDQGRWIVDCPSCAAAQLAGPEGPGHDRFFCVECLNSAHGGQWLEVTWPAPADLTAIEAALDARPGPMNRHWDHTETIGALLFENVARGELYDTATGEVFGDIGHDQQAVLVAPKGLRILPGSDRALPEAS